MTSGWIRVSFVAMALNGLLTAGGRGLADEAAACDESAAISSPGMLSHAV